MSWEKRNQFVASATSEFRMGIIHAVRIQSYPIRRQGIRAQNCVSTHFCNGQPCSERYDWRNVDKRSFGAQRIDLQPA